MTSKMKTVARSLGLNSVYHNLVRNPINAVQTSIREGGPWQQRLTEQGRIDMVAAAHRLPPLMRHDPDRPIYDLYLMTGRKYWYQTVFCFYSLMLFSEIDFRPIIIDDGSIDNEIEDALCRVIPWIRIRKIDELQDTVGTILPVNRYPAIHQWRKRQPLTRKIIDLHAGQSGWKMLLDSDMLFFRRPDWLIEWSLNPDRPAYMVDCVEAYGYSAELRAEVGGSADFPDRANIGLFGWRSEDVDFDWLEYALATLIEREGPRYNLTQGLTSMMFAGRQCAVAPEHDYVVRPELAEGRHPTAVLHHYVAESKRSFFQHGWQRVAALAETATGNK